MSPALPPGHTLSSSDFLWFTTPFAATRPADLARPSSEEMYDESMFLQPWLQYTRAKGLNAPLWNPYQLGGMPLLGTANGTPYAPLYLPLYLLPFWWSLAISAALKLFLAAFGTFLLARALGMRFAGAMLSGLTFGFCMFMIIWLAWPQTSVWPLIPWMLLLTEHLVRRPGPLVAAGLGTVVEQQFIGGHPESSFQALVAVAAFFILRVFMLWGKRGLEQRMLLPRVGALGGAVVAGTAVGAVFVIPFLELLRHSKDSGLRAQLAPKLGMNAIGGLFVPAFWGRGSGTVVGVTPTVNRYIFAGGLPLVLALASLVMRRSVLRIALAAFALVCLAVALGVPGIFEAVRVLPGFKQADDRRLVLFYTLCVALLAGFGLDDLVQTRGTAGLKRHRALAVAGLLALVSLIWVFMVCTHRRARSGGPCGSSGGAVSPRRESCSGWSGWRLSACC